MLLVYGAYGTYCTFVDTYCPGMTNPTFLINAPFTVLGYAVRTDDPGSQNAIPQLWARAYSEGLFDAIPGRCDENDAWAFDDSRKED